MGLDRGINYHHNDNYNTMHVIKLTWTPYMYIAVYDKYVSIKTNNNKAQMVKNWHRICLQCRRCKFNPWVGKIPWRRNDNHSSILAWRFPWTGEPGGL